MTTYGIEKATLIKNERRFTQTKGTTLTVAPMVDELGLLGIGKVADNILKVEYTPQVGIEEGVANIFEHIHCIPSI